MIKLINVNKFYNKHRRNQIHAINNTTLELENKGMVSFLGESGCGKTTLLNAIGGLNKINKGKIYINGKKLPKRTGYKKDKIRTLNIGYIFQNYNLLENETVYENVRISLKMIGIKDKEVVKKRVEYVLEKVDMYRFRNRLISTLSGGQKQRVAIARAIVKNPLIIIADEPTGNLDRKNTIDIMNIIKEISKEKLVILVTHERELAEFYSDVIYNIKNGKVINVINAKDINELDYKFDNNIYLKDFSNSKCVELDNFELNLYSQNEEIANLDIILKNGNIFIRSNTNNKIEVVDEDSSIELINDNYKKINKENYCKDTFDIDKLSNREYKLKYKSVYGIFRMIKDGFFKLFNYKFIKKILLLVFVVSTALLEMTVSLLLAYNKIDDKYFIEMDKNYLLVNSKDIATYDKIKKLDNVKYVLASSPYLDFKINNKVIYQYNKGFDYRIPISGLSLISDKDIIYGRMPLNEQEVILDKMQYENNDSTYYDIPLKNIGIKDLKSLIGVKLKYNSLSYEIVGIVDKKSPSLYINENQFEKIYESKKIYTENYKLYKTYVDGEFSLKEGRLPINDYEVIVNIINKEELPINKQTKEEINGNKLTVVGYYDSPRFNDYYYINSNTFKYKYLSLNRYYSIYSINKKQTTKELKDMNYDVTDQYEQLRKKYKKSKQSDTKEIAIVALVLLAFSIVQMYLFVRSSFLTKISEVGIKRAIGIKKTDIYRMFFGEILSVIMLIIIPSSIVTYMILVPLEKISHILDTRKYIMLISIGILSLLYIIIGLLPVYRTLRKEPADILARNDIN